MHVSRFPFNNENGAEGRGWTHEGYTEEKCQASNKRNLYLASIYRRKTKRGWSTKDPHRKPNRMNEIVDEERRTWTKDLWKRVEKCEAERKKRKSAEEENKNLFDSDSNNNNLVRRLMKRKRLLWLLGCSGSLSIKNFVPFSENAALPLWFIKFWRFCFSSFTPNHSHSFWITEEFFGSRQTVCQPQKRKRAERRMRRTRKE